MKPVGKIENVDLRDVWPDEARNFTPWLASKDGLELLGNEIGVELEQPQVEKRIGSYKADILAKISGDHEEDEQIVIIENQLDQTNHDHLGKILTYAAGQNAVMVIWIAQTFTDDHRQTIDWLNENMQNVDFFALQIELIKVDDSLPAPHFNIVSSPNEWRKKLKSITARELSEVQLDQLKFWEELRSHALKNPSVIRLTHKPRAQNWYEISIGRSGFAISQTVNTREKRVGCEIYISTKESKKAFDLLYGNKEDIESELGYELDWQRLDNRKACRIVVYEDGSLGTQKKRQKAIDWLYKKGNEFYKVFSHRIQELDL